jgi:hypothetical protein
VAFIAASDFPGSVLELTDVNWDLLLGIQRARDRDELRDMQGVGLGNLKWCGTGYGTFTGTLTSKGTFFSTVYGTFFSTTTV